MIFLTISEACIWGWHKWISPGMWGYGTERYFLLRKDSPDISQSYFWHRSTVELVWTSCDWYALTSLRFFFSYPIFPPCLFLFSTQPSFIFIKSIFPVTLHHSCPLPVRCTSQTSFPYRICMLRIFGVFFVCFLIISLKVNYRSDLTSSTPSFLAAFHLWSLWFLVIWFFGVFFFVFQLSCGRWLLKSSLLLLVTVFHSTIWSPIQIYPLQRTCASLI